MTAASAESDEALPVAAPAREATAAPSALYARAAVEAAEVATQRLSDEGWDVPRVEVEVGLLARRSTPERVGAPAVADREVDAELFTQLLASAPTSPPRQGRLIPSWTRIAR